MNKRFLTLIVLLAVYNFVFWHEALGLNAVIFSVLTSIALLILYKESLKSKFVLISLVSVLLTCALVLLHNSAFSVSSLIVSLVAFTGFVHQKEIRTLISAGFTSFLSFFLFPYNIIEGSRRSSSRFKVLRFVFKSVKLAILPVLIVVVFYSLYAYANPLFNSYSVSFWDKINESLQIIFKSYPIERFLFILLGLIILMGILYNNNITAFRNIDNMLFDRLIRDKSKKLVYRVKAARSVPYLVQWGVISPRMNSLIGEYRVGIILLVMVNLLLMILNILDINFLWFGFDSKQVDNLAYYVHEGTYVLIFSILLSMAILLYLFRGNISFYSRNLLLKLLAYFWIFQNGIMAISVALRNIYYIQYYYALSYKRIGVMVFLMLTFAGLITMALKIRDKRTLFNIIKLNTWIVFAVMLFISAFNWDVFIAEFNLSNPKISNVDVRYLLSLSDDVLPVLEEHKGQLDVQFFDNRYFIPDDKDGLSEYEKRKSNFIADYEKHSWLSWNKTDSDTYRYLKNSLNSRNKREAEPLNY